MAHELSVTLTIDGKHFNFSSVKPGGKRRTQREIVREFRAGRLKPLQGPFKSIEKAVKAAKKRSESFRGGAQILKRKQ